MSDISSTLVWRIDPLPEASLGKRLRHVRGTLRSPVTRAFLEKGVDLCQVAHGESYGCKPIDQERYEASAAKRRQLRKEAAELVVGQRGTRPGTWCELVAVGGKVIDWTPKQAEAWRDDLMKAFRHLMPEAVVIGAALHGDETEWHIHVAMQPRGRDSKGRLRLGQTAMRRQADSIVSGLPVEDRIGRGARRNRSSSLLTYLHETVGRRHGLERGKEGSNREHLPVDPVEAALARLREIARLRERVRLELEAAEARQEELDELVKRYKSIEAAEAELNARARRIAAAQARRVERYNAAVVKYNEAVRRHRERREADERALADQRAAIEKDAQALEVRRNKAADDEAESEKRQQKVAEQERALAARVARFEADRKAAVELHNERAGKLRARAEKLGERESAIRKREAAQAARGAKQELATKVLDAHIYDNLDPENARDSVFAALEGVELPDFVKAYIDPKPVGETRERPTPDSLARGGKKGQGPRIASRSAAHDDGHGAR